MHTAGLWYIVRHHVYVVNVPLFVSSLQKRKIIIDEYMRRGTPQFSESTENAGTNPAVVVLPQSEPQKLRPARMMGTVGFVTTCVVFLVRIKVK